MSGESSSKDEGILPGIKLRPSAMLTLADIREMRDLLKKKQPEEERQMSPESGERKKRVLKRKSDGETKEQPYNFDYRNLKPKVSGYFLDESNVSLNSNEHAQVNSETKSAIRKGSFFLKPSKLDMNSLFSESKGNPQADKKNVEPKCVDAAKQESKKDVNVSAQEKKAPNIAHTDPSNPWNILNEANVRRYLLRKPITATNLIRTFVRKKLPLRAVQIKDALYKNMIKIDYTERIINGTIHYSIEEKTTQPAIPFNLELYKMQRLEQKLEREKRKEQKSNKRSVKVSEISDSETSADDDDEEESD